MKNIFNKLILLAVFVTFSASAQINTNFNTTASLTDTNFFMDASNFESLLNTSFGKGLGFPRTDLTTFTFDTAPIDFSTIVSDFDGMVVYNSVLGNTGNTPATQGQMVAVSPGFYYFSNPGNPGNVTNGRWVPIGGAGNGIKTREVIKTINPGANTAIVNLNDGDAGAGSGMSAVTVNEFIGAKVYVNNVAKDLQMSATSGYNKGSNELTTGNGFMYQVLAPGTYRFVIEYK